VLAGGILAGQPLMNELVREALTAVLPRAPVATLDRPPVQGAVDLAAAMASTRPPGCHHGDAVVP
jgi:hypothetical protein